MDVVGRLFLDAGDMNYAQRDITADCLVDRPSNRIGGSLRAVHADQITAEADLSIIFDSII